MSKTGYDDQAQAAVRDASRWVDTNETASSGYIPRAELPSAYATLVQQFEDSDPSSHTACERLTAGGPQVVHWFTEWPTRAWCQPCALYKLRRLARKRRPCFGCGVATVGEAEATNGNLVMHGPMCDRCGSPSRGGHA
jgi:hypothetical protein